MRKAELDGRTGKRVKYLPIDSLPLPSAVRLNDSETRLLWTWGEGSSLRIKKAPADLVDRFGELADAEPGKILDFARTWGTLGICSHGLPSAHTDSSGWFGAVQDRICLPAPNAVPGWFEEPLKRWRDFADCVAVVARLAPYLRRARKGSRGRQAEICRDLVTRLYVHHLRFRFGAAATCGEAKSMGEDSIAAHVQTFNRANERLVAPFLARRFAEESTLERERDLVASVLNGLLALAGVRPSLRWYEPQPKMVTSAGGGTRIDSKRDLVDYGHPLLGTVVLRLVAKVQDSKGLELCANPRCQNYFEVHRGNQRYCEQCAGAAANRIRVARFRARKRGTI